MAAKEKPTRKWLQAHKERIDGVLEDLRTDSFSWVKETIPVYYSQGVLAADNDLGVEARLATGTLHEETLSILTENAIASFDQCVWTIGRTCNDVYRTLSLNSVVGSTIGYGTVKESAKILKDTLAEKGITGFKDRAGRNWNMASYAEMVSRTTTMQARLRGQWNEFVNHGEDLVRVSSHATKCSLCAPWEDRILSISGHSEQFDSIESAMAAGLFHPNCMHATSLYVDPREVKDAEKWMQETIAIQEQRKANPTGLSSEEQEELKKVRERFASTKIRPTRDWKEKAERRLYDAFSTLSEKIGIDAEKLLDKIDVALKEHLADGDLTIRIDAYHLTHVLHDGRFKSQFELAHSGGCYDPNFRSDIEKELMGYAKTATDPKNRPIYGAFVKNKTGQQIEDLENYGDCYVKINPAMRKNVTVCWGDSMDEAYRSKSAFPRPIDKPDWRCLPKCTAWQIEDEYNETKDIDSAIKNTIGKMGTGETNTYMEIQFHGRVTKGDILSIHNIEGDEELVSGLAYKYGIPFVSKEGFW